MPKDKLLHLAAGALTGLSAFLIGWYGLLVVLGVGVAKELWDASGHGTPDTLDAVATFCGGAVVVAIIMLGRSL